MRQIFNFHLISTFILLLLFSSCRQEKYIGTLTDFPGEKEGEIEAYSEDGKLYEKGTFKNGVLDGNRKIYYPSGQLQIIETYKAGIFEGPFIKYYENGKKKVEGDYLNASMEGIWKTYYEDGTLKDEVTMHDNMENGPFKEYHQNGKPKAIGTYKDGESEHGLLQLFDESGTLVKKMECDLGVCRTVWKLETE